MNIREALIQVALNLPEAILFTLLFMSWFDFKYRDNKLKFYIVIILLTLCNYYLPLIAINTETHLLFLFVSFTLILSTAFKVKILDFNTLKPILISVITLLLVDMARWRLFGIPQFNTIDHVMYMIPNRIIQFSIIYVLHKFRKGGKTMTTFKWFGGDIERR